MIGFLVTMLLESYRAPRVAMRRVLDMIESFEGVALLFGVSFTVNTLLVLLIAEMAGQGGADFGYLLEFRVQPVWLSRRGDFDLLDREAFWRAGPVARYFDRRGLA